MSSSLAGVAGGVGTSGCVSRSASSSIFSTAAAYAASTSPSSSAWLTMRIVWLTWSKMRNVLVSMNTDSGSPSESFSGDGSLSK